MLEIVPYQDRWPAEFRQIGAVIRKGIGKLVLRVDHIGSTSVPGLAAKDILDIQVTVAQFDDQLKTAITAAGYLLRENIRHDHIPPGLTGPETDWQKWFLRVPQVSRLVNVHVREHGKPNQRYALLFRDYLRAHPPTAAAYAELKRRLVASLANQEDYPEVKDPAVDLIYFAAEDWAEKVSWHPGPSDI